MPSPVRGPEGDHQDVDGPDGQQPDHDRDLQPTWEKVGLYLPPADAGPASARTASMFTMKTITVRRIRIGSLLTR